MPNGIGDVGFSAGCENLFEVIATLKQLGLRLGEQKKTLWAWLRQEACLKHPDVRRLLFGEISEDEFCRLHPTHPACREGE